MQSERRLKRHKPSEFADQGQCAARWSRTRLWLFDMDDTLFEASAGMFAQIHRRMESYIAKVMDIDVETAATIQADYWREYGATFVGLERHHGIKPADFFQATHVFDKKPWLKSNLSSSALRQLLASLPGKKILITNGPRVYAHDVLQQMHLQGAFDGVVAAEDMKQLGKHRSKPDKVLFASVLARAGCSAHETVLIEDSPQNLRAAKSMGMHTVWVRGYRKKIPHQQTSAAPWADAVIADLRGLIDIMKRARHVQDGRIQPLVRRPLSGIRRKEVGT